MPIARPRWDICEVSSPKASGLLLPTMRSDRPDAHTSLREYPYVVVRFRCHVCQRGGDSRLAVLAHKFGPGTLIGASLWPVRGAVTSRGHRGGSIVLTVPASIAGMP